MKQSDAPNATQRLSGDGAPDPGRVTMPSQPHDEAVWDSDPEALQREAAAVLEAAQRADTERCSESQDAIEAGRVAMLPPSEPPLTVREELVPGGELRDFMARVGNFIERTEQSQRAMSEQLRKLARVVGGTHKVACDCFSAVNEYGDRATRALQEAARANRRIDDLEPPPGGRNGGAELALVHSARNGPGGE